MAKLMLLRSQFVNYLVCHRLPARILCKRIIHISEISGRCHKHSNERNASKRVCILHSIQNIASTIAGNEH